MSRFPALVAAIWLVAPTLAAAPEKAADLRDKALTDTTAWTLLESLTSEIGPRPVGSPAYERARGWTIAKLKSLGFANIRVETFAKPSWRRGAESAAIVAPSPQKLAVIGLGETVPTPKKGIVAEVVVLKDYAELLAAPPGAFKGKIVLVNQVMARSEDGSGYGATVQIRNGDGEAAKRGAVAYLIRSVSTGTGRAPHTGAIWGEGTGKIPAAALGVPDADSVAALAAKGPVRIALNLASKKNPKTVAFDISADIVGSEKPDEIVVIGGHIDSWDPGTGAIDDGAGLAITTAAAKLIADLPHHPRRTIRLVWWGSEECGGSSDAYLAAHRSELGKFVATSEADLGGDRVLHVALPARAAGQPAWAGLPDILAPLKVDVAAEPARHGGSDVSGLVKAGVPVFSIDQDASRYFDYHHSADDTLAVVDRAQLDQAVAVWASVVYLIADSDFDFRARPSP